jgi:phage-related protein
MAAIDIGSAMKLLHSSNAKANEVQQDPLIKDIFSQLRVINQKTKQINDAVRGGDKDKAEQLRKDIQIIREDIKKNSEVSDEILDSQDSAKEFLQEKVLESIQDELAGVTVDIVGELVAMLGKSKGKDSTGVDSEENIMMVVTGAIRNAGIKNQIDVKTIVNFLKAMQGDISTSNAGIRDIIKNNNYVSNVVDDILEGANKFQKKMEKWKTFMANPLGFIKPIFQSVGTILSLIWKTIIPTIVSLAISFFTVVLPWILLILAIVALTIIVLYLLWKHFGGYIKKLWNYVKEYVVDYFVMVWKVVKEVLSWIWDTLKFAWGVITDIYDFVDLIFSGDFIGASKIIIRLMDRIVQYISGTFEHIFNIFAHFGEFLSKLPVIGPVFKFLFNILMPFMRFFIEAFKWVYSFFKDYVSVVWQNIVDMIGVVQSIFAGDFDGAMVIVDKMFERTVNFLTEHIISALIILQKLGNSLLTPIQWLWDSFKVAWDYYTGSFDKVWGFIQSLPTSLIGGVKDALSGLGDAFNPFNWFAKGGIVTGPTKAIIGEAGPEAVIPLEGSGKTTLTSLLTNFFNEFLKPVVDYVMNTLKDLINIIVGGIEKVFSIVEKVFNFVFDIFKPYMPILQSVLDAIYSVVYSIISGLAQLPSWLGGEFFASMLNSMAPPKKGGGGTAKPTDDKTLLLSMLSGNISKEPVLGVVGQNKAEIKKLDSSKIPMFPSTLTQLGKYIANASQSIEVPEYAKNLQEGIREIGDSIDEVADKLSSMESNILGAVGNSGSKVVTQDKQLELAKLMSRNSYNGGKV